MDIKFEGRNVELGDELRERIQKRMEAMDRRFGPVTHARVSVQKNAHKNEGRAEVTAVVNVSGTTLTAKRESATVVAAVNDALETLDLELQHFTEKHKEHRR
ncbi:MAG: ribosome-associated translation inhibitor RaiA [Magnetococcales bacterium]|nr:ribosome-associated translation inhibitor RaiA [Magnetococcales bacterium]MBF0322879.1 ribosome-associated translation inhibitor RaiA [Magnetococcales bacterium]